MTEDKAKEIAANLSYPTLGFEKRREAIARALLDAYNQGCDAQWRKDHAAQIDAAWDFQTR